MELFSKRLNILRKEANITQAQLAAILGVSPPTMSIYENNREPPYDTLCKIAKIFNVSTDYLVGHSEYKHTVDAADANVFSKALECNSDFEAIHKQCIEMQNSISNYISKGAKVGSFPFEISSKLFTQSEKSREMLRNEKLARLFVINCLYKDLADIANVLTDELFTSDIIDDAPDLQDTTLV